MPNRPVDIYVGGMLIQSGVSEQIEMKTPELANGLFKYRLSIRDQLDSTRGGEFEITGIEAGKMVTVDLRSSI